MKNTTTAGSLLAISVLSVPAAVQAADQTQPVIVTATRTAQIADASVAPVIVITRQELQQNPNADIGDLLQMYAGIEMGRNGGPGQSESIFMRGTNSNQTLVMIDGIKINPGTLGNAALQNIDLSMVDHIEVVLGPRSTLYGSEAIGGVINIITRQHTRQGSSYNAAIGGGSYNTRELSLGAYNTSGDRSAGIQISGVKSDGFPTKSASNLDRGYDNLNISLYGSQKIGDTRYQIRHWQSTGNTQYLDYFNNPLDQDFQNSLTAISAKTPVTDSWLSTLKLSHFSDKIDQNQPNSSSGNRKDFAHTSRYAIDWQNDLQWNPANLLTAGLYRSQENTAALSFGTEFDRDNDTNAFYAQNVRTTKRTTLITGLRFTNNQAYGDHSTWNLEYGLNLTPSLRLTLANNSGFRAPSNTELYGYDGNPDLKPEESINNEIGLRYQMTHNQRVSLNVFHNRITNLIIDQSNKNQNIEKATITGSELAYEVVLDHWSARASAVVQNPHNDSNDKQLARRSEHNYDLMLKYHGEDYGVGVSAHYSGNRPDSDFNSHVLAPYTLVNLSGDYRFSKRLTLDVRIVNLTNEVYQLAYGYNTPERSAYAELRYAID